MSKVVKAVSGIFGGGPEPEKIRRDFNRNVSTIGGQMTPQQMAEQRAALAAQGRRPKEEELRRQREMGTRPLQGSGGTSSFWS